MNALRISLTAVLIVLVSNGFLSAAEPGLRYRLSPGLHLAYESTSKSTGDRTDTSTSLTDLWVLKANADGGWHIFAQSGTNTESFDLAPDGKSTSPISGLRMMLENFFPPLPADPAAKEWTGTNAFGELTRYSLDGAPQAGVYRINAVQDSDMNRIYLMKMSRSITLDPQRGFVTASTSKGEQRYGFNVQFSDEMKLKSSDSIDAATLASYATDDEVYHAAMKSYTNFLKKAETDPSALEPARQALVDAKPKLKTEMFKKIIDDSLKSLDGETDYLKSSARDIAAIKNKPAPSWELRDLTGSTFKMSDMTGKVVILDFWYRGCGWCIRAMPQMRQIVDDFKDKPVAVFGMNTDTVVADAQFTSDAMKLNYPTLLLGSDRKIVDALGVKGFPTLIIIGPDGVVRDVHVGWSATLKEDVEASVKRPLNSGN